MDESFEILFHKHVIGGQKFYIKKINTKVLNILVLTNQNVPSDHYSPIRNKSKSQTGCPKSALRGGKATFLIFFFIGASAIESSEKSRIFRLGMPEDFLSRGQKTTREGSTAISLPNFYQCDRKQNVTKR